MHGCKLSPAWILSAVGALASMTALVDVPLPAAEGPGSKPNIIVIVADDLGAAEIPCQGKQDIPTPRIRSIAEAGVCFASGISVEQIVRQVYAVVAKNDAKTHETHVYHDGKIRRRSSL